MKRNIIHVYRFIREFGFDPIAFLITIKGLPLYFISIRKLIKDRKTDNNFKIKRFYPILRDRKSNSGVMSGHYFHQDLLVARIIYKTNPIRHIDIGSRTDGFVAHVATFREIEVLDIRDQPNQIENILFTKADLSKLPENLIECCDSVSALHSIEHFGLGRYGDDIDYWGHKKAINNISKILKKEGKFYFSVPIGPQRIEFNAHRVFSMKYLIDLLEEDFKILSFSFVDDKGDLTENVDFNETNIENNFGCYYGCGIFVLCKI